MMAAANILDVHPHAKMWHQCSVDYSLLIILSWRVLVLNMRLLLNLPQNIQL